MTNRKSRAPKSLFVVICTTSENNRLLYKIKELNHMKIKVELLRKKYALQQCYRFQSFFHSSKFCTRAPRCVKRTGDHSTKKQAKERRRKNQSKTGKEVNDPSSICSQSVGTKAPATQNTLQPMFAPRQVCPTQSKSSTSTIQPEPTSTASQSPQTPSNPSLEKPDLFSQLRDPEVIPIPHLKSPGEIMDIILYLDNIKASGTDGIKSIALKAFPLNAITNLNSGRSSLVVKHGFRENTSTLHQLPQVNNHIIDGLSQRMITGGVFLNVQKAFDRMWHDGLINKLFTLKFPPYLIHIINSYLPHRAFKVKINHFLSSKGEINASTRTGVTMDIPFTHMMPCVSYPKGDRSKNCSVDKERHEIFYFSLERGAFLLTRLSQVL
ncbi:putative RNA-directed DNA polymerase from transposon BS [Trichonephila clavipes]|nr:putative RNA-directed DNA polymerase from transposon BS [Trichonephila clavipes]